MVNEQINEFFKDIWFGSGLVKGDTEMDHH